MQIPRFPECYHALVEDALSHDDQTLLRQLQRHPESGRCFVALFCRYSPLVYSLIRHATQSSVQVDYLFAQTWKQIYQDLQDVSPESFGEGSPDEGMETAAEGSAGEVKAALSPNTISPNIASTSSASPDRRESSGAGTGKVGADGIANSGGDRRPRLASDFTGNVSTPMTLQNWIIDIAARYIREAPPEADQIRYSLTYAPPPLWCYLERSLEQLSPVHRLVVVLHKRFGWSLEEVASHLASTGMEVDTAAVITLLGEGYDQIDESLPQDIREIYLEPSAARPL